MMRTIQLAVACVAVLIATGGQVQAGILLDGQIIGYQYLFSTQASVYYDPGDILVGPGAETNIASSSGIYGTVDISDTNITVNFVRTGTWSTAPFNGFRVFDKYGILPDFTDFSVNAASTMPGLDSSRLTFDANNLYVNWQGLSYGPSFIASFDVNSSAGPPNTVPEPTSLAVFAIGACVAGLGAACRRREKQQVAIA